MMWDIFVEIIRVMITANDSTITKLTFKES